MKTLKLIKSFNLSQRTVKIFLALIVAVSTFLEVNETSIHLSNQNSNIKSSSDPHLDGKPSWEILLTN